ncbi:MAG: STT3 domain-containing protein [Candidatus Diapherotrites archaeon]
MKVWEFVQAHRTELLVIVAIFLLAFGIRAFLFQYQYPFEFDPYFHGRMTYYVASTESAPASDPLTYYQDPRVIANDLSSPLFWRLGAVLYLISNGGSTAYNEEAMVWVMKLVPALFGALAVVALYFFIREIWKKKAAMAAALLAASIPAFVYRTMAGFYEPTSSGFLWIIAGMFFLAKALKNLGDWKKVLAYGLGAGVMFGILSQFWKGSVFLPIILVPSMVLIAVSVWAKENDWKKALLSVVPFLLSMLLILLFIASTGDQSLGSGFFGFFTASISSVTGTSGDLASGVGTSLPIIVFAGVIGFLAVFGFILYAAFTIHNLRKNGWKAKEHVGSIALLAIAIILLQTLPILWPAFGILGDFIGSAVAAMIATFIWGGFKKTDWELKKEAPKLFVVAILYFLLIVLCAVFASGVNLAPSGVGSGIGEESQGIPFFLNKYNALFFLPILAFAILPFYWWKRPQDHASIMVFFLALVTLFMAWTKLKFTFLFGLPLAAISAVLFYVAFERLKKTNLKRFAIVGLSFCLLVGVAAGFYFVSQNVPNIEYGQGWKEGLHWAHDNLPADAKIFNWWNDGHWISFFTQRKTAIDNRNASPQSNSDVSKFIITSDENEANSIIQKFGSTHIMFSDDTDSLFSGQASFAMYAFNTTDTSNPQLAAYLGSYGGVMPCNKQTTAVSGSTTFVCGPNNIPESQFNSIPTEWTETASQASGRELLFVYRSKENDRLYILNATANNSEIAKLWFHKPSVAAKYEEIYSFESVKIFKVK